MKRIAQFFKVSPENFIGAVTEEFSQYTREQAEEMYEKLHLPVRAMIFLLLFHFPCRRGRVSRCPRESV